jgi:predicted kinase
MLVLMVGVPGSGKTWLLERFLPDAHVIRPDDHIGYTKENPWTPAAAKAAWDRAHADLKEALKADGPDTIAFDATMVGARKRRRYVRMAEKAGVYPVAIHVDTPIDVCRARNDARDQARRVPDATMLSMQGRLETPQTQEGFAVVANFCMGGLITKSSKATDPDGDVFREICRRMAEFRDRNPDESEGVEDR